MRNGDKLYSFINRIFEGIHIKLPMLIIGNDDNFHAVAFLGLEEGDEVAAVFVAASSQKNDVAVQKDVQ